MGILTNLCLFISVQLIEIAHMGFNGNQKSPEGDKIGTRETKGDGRFNTPLRQDNSAFLKCFFTEKQILAIC